jgi:DNA (cytosine-5)-methyltransferase 1
MADTDGIGLDGVSEAWLHDQWSLWNDVARRGGHDHWSDVLWAVGSDGKARRVEPSIQLLAHGVPARVGKLRAFGNAIVPQVAAQVMMSFLESVQ